MFKKRFVNCFLLTWLLVLGVDAAPDMGDWHRNLKEKLDPFLDVTGLWQGNWNLFAPEPDKINVAITAEVIFPDGEEIVWRSPEWRSMSAWQRFLSFREAEFIDNVRKDVFQVVWSTFADYLSQLVVHPTNPELKPTGIILTRHWVIIPAPNSDNVKQFPELPDMDSSYIFFAKDLLP